MHRSPWALCFVLGLSIVGCGGGGPRVLSPDAKSQEILGDVGELYRLYSLGKKSPPKNFTDLESLRGIQPVGYNAVKDGRVVLNYGASMADLEEGPPKGNSAEVLAYEKQVPESGGQALMLDRSVKKMTADEFKAAKQAGKN